MTHVTGVRDPVCLKKLGHEVPARDLRETVADHRGGLEEFAKEVNSETNPRAS